MAAPNYEQIQSFANVSNELMQAAQSEFLRAINADMTNEEIMQAAAAVAAKFRLLGAELGAQWYDLCARLAGVDVDPADVDAAVASYDASLVRAESAYGTYKAIPQGMAVDKFFADFVTSQVQASIRDTGNANLWRDYMRGVRGGRWARVPVGETCAWCLMLASNGAWYLTEESALGREAGHYHVHCNCVAVYYTDAERIAGYGQTLGEYKEMYYQAENTRIANARGTKSYPDYLANRIANAKAEHMQRNKELEEQGKDTVPWTVYNEDLIIMRDQFGLK